MEPETREARPEKPSSQGAQQAQRSEPEERGSASQGRSRQIWPDGGVWAEARGFVIVGSGAALAAQGAEVTCSPSVVFAWCLPGG